MKYTKSHLFNAFKSSLAYGLGLGLGIIITGLLYKVVDFAQLGLRIPSELLPIGLGLAFLIEFIGSGIGGAIGGLSLPLPPEKQRNRGSVAWRSGLSMGLVFSLLLFLMILVFSLLAFYDRYELNSAKFSLLFALAGAAFGSLFGLFLGLFLVRKHGAWLVVLAGLIGFGIGGFGLGDGIRRYLLTVESANLQSGNRFWLALAFLVFGMAGGAALGFAFSYLSEKEYKLRPLTWWQSAVVVVIVLLLIWMMAPVLAAAVEMFTPNDANLNVVLDSRTIGTHWSDSSTLSDMVTITGAPQLSVIAANETGEMALVWSQIEGNGSELYWLSGTWDEDLPNWQMPVTVSTSRAEVGTPQAVVANDGSTHIIWEEAGLLQYSHCQADSCSTPSIISEATSCAPEITSHTSPTLAIDDADNLLAVWVADGKQILFRLWPASIQAFAPVDCVPVTESDSVGEPRLDASSDSRFALVYMAGEGEISTLSFVDGQWGNSSSVVGNGRSPNILLDKQDETHIVWCSHENEVHYANQGTQQTVSTLSCGSRPEMAQDSEGVLHVVWFGDEVVDVNGRLLPDTLLYESTLTNNAWSSPSIISQTGMPTQPSIAATETNLHLVWQNSLSGVSDITYSSFIPYNCDDYPLDGISQVAYDEARRPQFRPPEDLIPYCQNQVHQLVHMPNPDPAFSDEQPYPNGGFDAFAELAQTAQYEVLFTTMWYEADENGDSPGYVLAESVAALYEKLKANPEQYPRGLTVRILTGNPPQLNLQPLSDQPYSVLANLRDAGVDKMVDPDIGWRVEVADFDGTMPHSHTKLMVIDGKTTLTAGFNMEYKHYAVDHPSGLGQSKQDLGVLVSGPVVQNTHRVFDDLWEGSTQYTCADFYPSYVVWQATCRKGTAVADHVPEVLKYYLSGGDSTVFSMYRSKKHNEADLIVKNGLSAAQNQVDAMHVMFTMEMVCDLNVLYELCDFGEATEYLDGLMQAAENGATIRLILYPIPLNGIETTVAYDVFVNELENRGLRDQVEIRFLEKLIHYKTTLIDNEYLVVGSQNFHYSAYGQYKGLSEYGLGTSDAQAIEDYQRLFEYQWEQAVHR